MASAVNYLMKSSTAEFGLYFLQTENEKKSDFSAAPLMFFKPVEFHPQLCPKKKSMSIMEYGVQELKGGRAF